MDTSLTGMPPSYYDNFENYGTIDPSSSTAQVANWLAGTGNAIEVQSESTLLGDNSTNMVMGLNGPVGGESVSQDFATTTGHSYSISVDYSPLNGQLSNSAMGVYWEGQQVGTLSATTAGMQTYTFNVTANSTTGSSKLEFRSLDANNAGGAIDNVKLSDQTALVDNVLNQWVVAMYGGYGTQVLEDGDDDYSEFEADSEIDNN